MIRKKILLLVSVVSLFICANAQEISLTNGMKISKNIKVKKAIYKFDGTEKNEQPVILIEGNNITIDFNNCILKGSNSKKKPDEFFGTAVIIVNSNHVTIKNLNAKRYKVAIMAKNVTGLTIENCNFSYNYRQHLNSTQEKEDISDWMSYHHNENDEWLRYGAAMYLRNCSEAIIRNCKVTGGQNGLMMSDCNNNLICNNDFSFNSGIGIGMYRCNHNQVANNKLDFNVRGYSHGVYNRGQDSAGILVYEQSSNNIFYKNSVTHSGDGFFLWAGQTTMDTGKGGCNNNILFGNDFSYAPTNGVEVTFSTNKIFSNRIFECDNGIWGGYSYSTEISDNNFRNNNVGIAIEHGQNNDLHNNLFLMDKTGIKLWARKEQLSDWGYSKYRDTRSRSYNLINNSFNKNGIAIDVIRTDSLNIFGNYFSGTDKFLKIDSTVTHLDTAENKYLIDKFSNESDIKLPAFKNTIDPFKGMGKLAGKKNIMITEWGPYDFRYPIIWNTNPSDTIDVLKFDLIGPKGKWKIKSFKGVDHVSQTSGIFPAAITAKKIKSVKTDIEIDLEYSGEQITTFFGEIISKGKPYNFSFKKFFQPIEWTVNWYSLDTLINNPIKSGNLFPPNIKMMPVKTEHTQKFDYAWWGGINTDQGKFPQFITIAEGEAEIQNGEYLLSVTWDDAARVYVDDKLVINEWNPSMYNFDESPNKKIRMKLGGKHHFRVEHLELGGFATINLKLIPFNDLSRFSRF